MAKQTGIFRVEGSVDNMTFYKSIDGYRIRRKGGVSGERIATDKAFQRTRENVAEFSTAGKAGKLLRASLNSVIQRASDSRMVSRLTREIMKVIQADKTSARGQRNVIDGEVELLKGFDFNINGKLNTTLYAPYTATIDRATGIAQVDFPAFISGNMIAAPIGTTHYKVNASGVEIDFENGKFNIDTKSTEERPLNQASSTLQLACQLPANSTHSLLLVLGIEFSQEVNGARYPLLNGANNALAIVQVSGL